MGSFPNMKRDQSHPLGWQLLNKITSVADNVEKLEPMCTVGGDIKWCSCCGKQLDNSSKS